MPEKLTRKAGLWMVATPGFQLVKKFTVCECNIGFRQWHVENALIFAKYAGVYCSYHVGKCLTINLV